MNPSPQRKAPASLATRTPEAPDNKRRRFLLALGAGSAGTVAAAATLPLAPLAAPVVAEPQSGQGYRETEHVRDYYATTRI